FVKMNTAYEDEQHSLERRVSELKALIASEKESSANVDAFLSIVRKYTDIQKLTAEVIREFVEKIYVYQAEKVNGKRIQKVRIVWNCIGEFNIPAAEK
ncbi:MAG: DUF4368 domain-containing protein, partial [Lachnospiraceae bacterium]|nr:DUF4368 domain-containing protein [Lachnospiraceae bacterium]